jgi:protein farnesyltransferase/geranylgeranyltransferase type-1 subunit alpha
VAEQSIREVSEELSNMVSLSGSLINKLSSLMSNLRHHRHVIVSNKEQFPTLPTKEQDFLKEMFDLDSKNYHVWAYRQWLVRHFDLWDSEQEIQDVETLLNSDVRNNSAWNHRYFLRFAPRTGLSAGLAGAKVLGEPPGRFEVVDEDVIDAELDYAKGNILIAPENRSPWLYARGVLRAAGRPLSEWKDFAGRFVMEELDDNDNVLDVHVKSSLAVEWLADVYGEEAKASEDDAKENAAEAVKMFTLLKEKYDPIRKNYWDYRIRSVEGGLSSAVSA